MRDETILIEQANPTSPSALRLDASPLVQTIRRSLLSIPPTASYPPHRFKADEYASDFAIYFLALVVGALWIITESNLIMGDGPYV